MANKLCNHSQLTFEPSPVASAAGYVQPDKQKLFTAATGRRKQTSDNSIPTSIYPAPLVLPNDSLFQDSKQAPQSFRSWCSFPLRNQIDSRRNIIYIAEPPKIDEAVSFMYQWTQTGMLKKNPLKSPNIQNLVKYLETFYHGLDVKLLPSQFHFQPWSETSQSKAIDTNPKYIGLVSNHEMTRIRVRHLQPSSSSSSDEQSLIFTHQLNLYDLLDSAIETLPDDAYALLLVLEHDLYADEEDDFCCGLAFGGSRVAAISTARYHTALDDLQNIDTEHAWPASHCSRYINQLCRDYTDDIPVMKRPKLDPRPHDKPGEKPGTNALHAAIKAYSQPILKPNHSSFPVDSLADHSPIDSESTFLFRICRIASHEIAHCFSLDHCIYYACVMQSTTCLAEDNRQPAYLCPVCENKLHYAITKGRKVPTTVEAKGRKQGSIAGGGEDWSVERYRAILEFSERMSTGTERRRGIGTGREVGRVSGRGRGTGRIKGVGDSWGALAAWTRVVLHQL